MGRLLALFWLIFAVGLAGAAPARAQQLADEPSRRQALQLFRAGQELLGQEHFEEAAETFAQALKHDPLLALAYYGRGQAFMGLQRFTSAIQAYGDCIEAYRKLAAIAESDRIGVERQRDQEIRELRESIQAIRSGRVKTAQSPENIILRLESRVRDLEQQKQRGIQVFEAPAEVLLALGSAHFRNGDREQAEHYWSEAVKVNARLGEAWNNLAVIHLGAGRKKEAEDAVRNAERAGFRVNPRLKDDIRAMKG
jgi:tetratricopeptide (TPR) repeat protein